MIAGSTLRLRLYSRHPHPQPPSLLAPMRKQNIKYVCMIRDRHGFQIVDDILDFTSQTEKLGKPVASDLRQGLITLPTLYYIESYPNDMDIANVIEHDPCDEGCLDRLLTAIRDSGSIEKAQNEAEQHVVRAIDALSSLPECIERSSLIELARYIVGRNV